MNPKVIKQHLKAKGFTLADNSRVKVLSNNTVDVIAAYNLNTNIVVSWVVSDNPKIPHTVVICYKNSTDIRFKGKITNLQQFNLILSAVE